jgi:hypothetical protein
MQFGFSCSVPPQFGAQEDFGPDNINITSNQNEKPQMYEGNSTGRYC